MEKQQEFYGIIEVPHQRKCYLWEFATKRAYEAHKADKDNGFHDLSRVIFLESLEDVVEEMERADTYKGHQWVGISTICSNILMNHYVSEEEDEAHFDDDYASDYDDEV